MEHKGEYLIIAGTNKAATTSFYEYLAAHPDICPAYIKQTFFFLDKSWQEKLDSKSLFDYADGYEHFDQFFKGWQSEKFKLEASPEYLYAPDTPDRIKSFLNKYPGRVIFILRKPSTRFVSLFYFGMQQGIISPTTSFKEFLDASIAHTENTNHSLMAFETGFYSKYLEKYVELFGKDKISVLFFEDLMKDHRSFMKNVAKSLDIDEGFYDDFEFEQFNKTIRVKNPFLHSVYKISRKFLIEQLYTTKAGYAVGSVLKRAISPVYKRINTVELEKRPIEKSDIEFLEKAYQDEKAKLEKLLDIKVPWD